MSTYTATVPAEDGTRPQDIEVSFVVGESYLVGIRDHEVLVDQPVDEGGADLAATPTELFVASLAACVAFYAGRYLTRHGLRRTGLCVRAAFAMAPDQPARVAAVRIRVDAPTLPARRRDALRAVVAHCTVHNTLERPPHVEIEVS